MSQSTRTNLEKYLMLCYELDWHRSVGLATEEFEDAQADKMEALWYELTDEENEALAEMTGKLADIYAAAHKQKPQQAGQPA